MILSSIILTTLALLYSAALAEGLLPLSMLSVTMLFFLKKGKTPSQVGSYRPISLLSVFLKTMERIVYVRMLEQIDEQGEIDKHQFAYLKGRNGEMMLHELLQGVAQGQDEWHAFISTDIEGAYDSVPRIVLLRALRKAGISPGLCNFVWNLLRNRWMKVRLGPPGTHSSREEFCIESGLPQGGVLSPLLWVILMREVARKLVDDHDVPFCAFYADDGTLRVSGFSPQDVAEKINKLLPILKKILADLGLTLDTTKTTVMWIAPGEKEKITNPHIMSKGGQLNLPPGGPPPCRDQFNNPMPNVHLKEVSVQRVLGILIDQELTMKYQVDKLISECKARINILRYVAKRMHTRAVCITAYALIVGRVAYAVSSWAAYAQSAELRRLNVAVLHPVARIILGPGSRPARLEALRFLTKIPSVYNLILTRSAIALDSALRGPPTIWKERILKVLDIPEDYQQNYDLEYQFLTISNKPYIAKLRLPQAKITSQMAAGRPPPKFGDQIEPIYVTTAPELPKSESDADYLEGSFFERALKTLQAIGWDCWAVQRDKSFWKTRSLHNLIIHEDCDDIDALNQQINDQFRLGDLIVTDGGFRPATPTDYSKGSSAAIYTNSSNRDTKDPEVRISAKVFGNAPSASFAEKLGLRDGLCQAVADNSPPSNTLLIITDCQSIIKAIRTNKRGSATIQPIIHEMLSSLAILCERYEQITIAHINSHMGITLHDTADEICSELLDWDSGFLPNIMSKSTVKKRIKKAMSKGEDKRLEGLRAKNSNSGEFLAGMHITQRWVKEFLEAPLERKFQRRVFSLLTTCRFKKIGPHGLQCVFCPYCGRVDSSDHFFQCSGITPQEVRDPSLLSHLAPLIRPSEMEQPQLTNNDVGSSTDSDTDSSSSDTDYI